MTQPFTRWTVLPHGKLAEVDENILTVVGELHMPMTELPRRMTVVRLQDGRLVIFSAIALDDDEMRSIEQYGTPAFLVVPNDIHRLDAKIWKERYPNMQVVAPEGSRMKIDEVVQVESTSPDFGDRNVEFITVPGTRGREAAMLVDTGNGTTLVLNDLVGNIRSEAGFGSWLLRVAGFAGDEAQIPRVVKLSLIEDKKALRSKLIEWSQIETLERILVSHGAIIDESPRDTLAELAASL
ncbi:hypothetical protein BH09PSE5_BH09PSE5_28900 [soil metagenome]